MITIFEYFFSAHPWIFFSCCIYEKVYCDYQLRSICIRLVIYFKHCSNTWIFCSNTELLCKMKRVLFLDQSNKQIKIAGGAKTPSSYTQIRSHKKMIKCDTRIFCEYCVVWNVARLGGSSVCLCFYVNVADYEFGINSHAPRFFEFKNGHKSAKKRDSSKWTLDLWSAASN